jgi:hypothetical protein
VASIRQASFAGGEFSPALGGRSDIDRYATGLRTCRNFIPTVEGAAHNRPGMKYVAMAGDPSRRVRLIPFAYSDEVAYVLEFGHEYIRIIKNGELLDPSVVRVDTPYQEEDLATLKYAQVGDVLWLTHANHAPRTLTRASDISWVLAQPVFSEITPEGLSAWGPATTYPSGDRVLFRGAAYSSRQSSNLNKRPDESPAWWEGISTPFGGLRPALETPSSPDVSGGMPAREWVWLVSAILQDATTGGLLETAPYRVIQTCNFAGTPPRLGDSPAVYTTITSNAWPVYPQKPVIIRWPLTAGALAEPDVHIVAWRVYRGRGEVFGFVGETRDRYFVDTGDAPDYSTPPRTGRNPFEVRSHTEAVLRTERPAVVGFFEQRLAFARTNERQGWFWLSAVGDFYDFDNPLFGGDSDAIEYELASLRREEIRSIVGLDKLYFFTSGGVWAGEDLGRLSVPSIKKHSEEGAAWVAPLVVRDALLYVRGKGIGVNELEFSEERGKHSVNELSVLAKHLFEAGEISDWAYAHDPFRVVWAIREDGGLLSLTYDRQQGVMAWAKHDTSDGEFEAVCAVPEGDEDAVYFVVRRHLVDNHGAPYSARFVERMATRRVTSLAAGLFLDCAATYAGEGLTTALVKGSLSSAYVVADGKALGWFDVSPESEVDFSAALPEGASIVHVGLPYTCDLELLDLAVPAQELRAKMKTVTACVFDVVASAAFKAGESFDALTEARVREIAFGYDAPTLLTGQVKVSVRGTWNRGGRAVLRQEEPAPISVLGVTREVEVGGT